jgi:signal transduction histidine kinase
VDASGKLFYHAENFRMKWIALVCLTSWLTCATQPLWAQSLPDDLIVKEVKVDGRKLSLSPNHSLNLGALPSDIQFQFGSLDNSHLPDRRVRYKLEGYDTDWHDGQCDMFLAVRFYNEAGDQVRGEEFRVAHERAGWKGSLATSALTHRRETITVPPRAARVLVVISSGGPPATIGLYVVANLTIVRIGSNAAPVKLMEFPPNRWLGEGTNVTPADWMRDGNVPSMAKIVTVGHSPALKALAILDSDPTSHAEWHNTLPTAPVVVPGEQILVEWNEMFTMGVADLHKAEYQLLPDGHYSFRLAEFDLFGKPTGIENVISVVVPPPLWRQPWFWPLCAAVATAIAFGNWRYLAWRKVRREVERLKNQQVLEKERLRIARDIHDDLGARITEISLASALAKKNVVLPAAAVADFDRISGMSRDLVAALYETVWAVNPENDNLDSLGTYLCQIANHLCKQAQLPCRLKMDELPRNVPVSSQVRHNIAMAVKEATHNAVKHAHASEITLRMTFEKPELTICIDDNGVGFKTDGSGPAAGKGLNNIQQRMANVGGSCHIESHPGRGTSIQMQLKL